MANLLLICLPQHCLSFNYLPAVWAAVEDLRENKGLLLHFQQCPSLNTDEVTSCRVWLYIGEMMVKGKKLTLNFAFYSKSFAIEKMYLLLFKCYDPEQVSFFFLFLSKKRITSLLPWGGSVVSPIEEICSCSRMLSALPRLPLGMAHASSGLCFLWASQGL